MSGAIANHAAAAEAPHGRSRIGAADADVILFAKGGRDHRLALLARGEEAPREFFYGFHHLQEAGLAGAMMSSAGRLPGLLGLAADTLERAAVRFTGIGARPLSARLFVRQLGHPKVLISFTDGFSLSLGLALARAPRPIVIGGFQGLSDVEARVAPFRRAVVARLIRRSLARLDQVFFLSPADRDAAVAAYGVDPAKVSIFAFGVDTEFWRPCPEVAPENFAFAIGQDWNRDFASLVAAPGAHPVRIVTSLRVAVPPGHDHVQMMTGDFSGRQITDEELRRIYNAARVVVVPSKDVLQPTGQSVTMQAMSCGRPVILSRIRGLWDPALLRDGENCLLVPPGDPAALGAAIERIFADPELAASLGRAARATALAGFNLEAMGRNTVALAQMGLKAWASAAT